VALYYIPPLVIFSVGLDVDLVRDFG
jgi:hypothetical protein